MEKLDYNELIDQLCIPSIKILREDLGVETMFCCQGKSGKEDPNHGRRGYIACKITPRSKEVLFRLTEMLSQVLSLPANVCRLEFMYSSRRSHGGNDMIIFRLKIGVNQRLVWKKIEEILEGIKKEEL